MAAHFDIAQRGTRVGKCIKCQVTIEQARSQRPIHRGEARERVIERTLRQNPKIDVVSGERQRPRIFELLCALEFGEAIRIRSGRRSMSADRGVHVEQGPIGIENECLRHMASRLPTRRPYVIECFKVRAASGESETTGRGCRKHAHS